MGNRLLIIQHERREGPGYIADWAAARNVALDIVDPKREMLPDGGYDGLIVLGGLMDVRDREKLSWLAREIDWLGRAIRQPIPVLGICLGSQLLAHALGADVIEMPTEELGWLPVNPVPGWKMGTGLVFHAHKYRFAIPAGARCLAESKLCPHQAFSAGDNILGLQFHLEWSADDIARLFPKYFARHGSPEIFHDAGRRALFEILDTHFSPLISVDAPSKSTSPLRRFAQRLYLQ
ncbi:GMP synthase-Glutamine amidotransferase [Microbulbifer donghaiensis]|uniref:GMP synthase-Glutamine amidotransferase n=1 Tax=Microbulbifer donghaiensis TaxID=494016 RepID=A0A1M5H7Y2_9GAMM|nr:type 1 glutamine amidotransferase [Microbulbifer donghaiensis]SHG12097.1 GMP synthase-Glutamine amidotransferase [Microbulbifer donghaiensis]